MAATRLLVPREHRVTQLQGDGTGLGRRIEREQLHARDVTRSSIAMASRRLVVTGMGGRLSTNTRP